MTIPGDHFRLSATRRAGHVAWRSAVLIALWIGAAPQAACGGIDQTEPYLAGLRARQLFSLAESYCRRQLADPQLTPADQAELTIELARTLAQHAINAPPRQREPLWNAAREAVAEYLRQRPADPQRLVVQLQDALTLLARGELARQEAEITGGDDARWNQARAALREAIGELTRLDEALGEDLRAAATGRSRGGLTEEQLISLQKNLRYQLARALRNQGLCYPADSPDRINSLTQAQRGLLALSAAPPLAWQIKLDEIRCLRLLGQLEEANRRLAALAQESPPADVALAARAEQARLKLAVGDAQGALSLFANGRQLEGETSPELDLALLETYAALARSAEQAGNGAQQSQWQDKGAAVVREIERAHGPYWTRRAEMLLTGSADAPGVSGNLELLVRIASDLYRRKQWDAAVEAYDSAAAKAAQLDDAAQAFSLAQAAAYIEYSQRRFDSARDRYRRLALASPDDPQAPQAHLSAVKIAAASARQHGEPALEAYDILLREHLERWPQAATADTAALWSAHRLEQQQQWEQASKAYRQVGADDAAQYQDAVSGTIRTGDRWLAALAAAAQPTRGAAIELVRYLEHAVHGGAGRWPERFSPLARDAALAAARYRLEHLAGHADAEVILQAALAASPDAPPEWLAQARTLLVLAYASGDKHEQAQQLIGQISGGSPAGLLSLLVRLEQLSRTATPEVGAQLARLELETIRLLDPPDTPAQLAAPDRIRLEMIRAAALAAAGRRAEALASYQQLAAQHPDNGALQQRYAELLLSQTDRPSLTLALARWREILRRSPPQSARWYQAKYAVAEAHYKLGEKQVAAQTIRLTSALYPELGGAELKARFLALLKQCES